jgi:hypothetical protein
MGGKNVMSRLGRGVSLRGLPDAMYDRERLELRHLGPYLPVIFEACQEHELSYEHRDGAASYGAFTYTLAKILRESRSAGRAPSFLALARLAADRLAALGYEQTPSVVGPRHVIRQKVPWIRSHAGRAGDRRSRR